MLIVKLVCLILGTALGALFILFTLRGKKRTGALKVCRRKSSAIRNCGLQALPCSSSRRFPWIRLSAKR